MAAMQGAGAREDAQKLAARYAAELNPAKILRVEIAPQKIRAGNDARKLAARFDDSALLKDPSADFAWLWIDLREAGEGEAALKLAARIASAPLSDQDAVAQLLVDLRRAGAKQQARTLVDRLPGEGWFELFREQPGHESRYRFGRELDGSPAPSWGWDDLD